MPSLSLKATLTRRQAAEAAAITEAATASANQDKAGSLDKGRDPHTL